MAAAAIRRIVATVRAGPGALLCWGGEEPIQSPAPGLSGSVHVPALNPSEGLCCSQEEGGMQEAGCSLPVCCEGSCLPAGQLLLPAPTPGTWLGAELCLSQQGEEGEILGEVGSVLSHVHGSSVNGFQGCSLQGVPDLQALLSHPYSRSLCSKGLSGWHSIQSLPARGGCEDPCQICRGVWCLPTARHGWELASSRR